MKYAPAIVKMKVMAFIDQSPEITIRARVRKASEIFFIDETSGEKYKFTWRTIDTWYYRYKNTGTASFLQRKRTDCGTFRKISPDQLAECVHIALKHLPKKTSNRARKTVIYHWLLENEYFSRSQLSPTTYYRFMREHEILKPEACQKLRLSFCLPFANDLWQGDTLHGPIVPGPKGKPTKTYLIALIDDCSKLITHAAFYPTEKIQDLTHAIKMAIYCRGIPNMLYFDNGSVYRSKTILDACARLNINLSHTPVRDGAAKGKIERLNGNIRNSFFKKYEDFKDIDHLNLLFKEWVSQYNSKVHSGIEMAPENRFSLDIRRIRYLENNEYNNEIFYTEALRVVNNTNTFSLHAKTYECPVDMRDRKVEVRYDPANPEFVVIYYKHKRIGKATFVNLQLNARLKREFKNKPE